QVRKASGVSGAAARKDGVNLVEVMHARHVDLLDLGENRRCKHCDGEGRHQPIDIHGISPSVGDITSVGDWWLLRTSYSSTVTVAGFTSLTVTGVPDGSVAALRPPATTAAVPAPAPADAPI